MATLLAIISFMSKVLSSVSVPQITIYVDGKKVKIGCFCGK